MPFTTVRRLWTLRVIRARAWVQKRCWVTQWRRTRAMLSKRSSMSVLSTIVVMGALSVGCAAKEDGPEGNAGAAGSGSGGTGAGNGGTSGEGDSGSGGGN